MACPLENTARQHDHGFAMQRPAVTGATAQASATAPTSATTQCCNSTDATALMQQFQDRWPLLNVQSQQYSAEHKEHTC
eukprot:8819692-Lingulodinium_polyedra.AAC.1